jgi:hypothetical protein
MPDAQPAPAPAPAPASLPTVDLAGVEILRPGEWNGREYTIADIDAMVAAFHALRGVYAPPGKLGHNPEQRLLTADGLPAAGWVKNLYRRGDRLLADFARIPAKVAELIRAGGYRARSAEIWFNARFGDQVYPVVLKAVSWLGEDAPAVSGLADVVALYSRHAEADDCYAVVLSTEEVAVGESHIITETSPAAANLAGMQAADTPWDAGKQVKAADIADLRAMCALVTGDGSRKGDYHLPHHSAAPGHPVNLHAVRNALARLDQVKGATAAEKARARAHLERHLHEAHAAAAEEHHALLLYGTATAFLADDSFAFIRARVQDALAAAYPAPADMGYAAGGDGPSACIQDLYPDRVIVWDQDCDALYQIPYSLDDAGVVRLGPPTPVKVTYEPLPAPGAAAAAEESAMRRQDGADQETTVTDAELRAILGVDETADLKQTLLSLRAQHVALSDHQQLQAEVAELRREKAEREAEALVETALAAGRLAPAQRDWAKAYCLSDRAGFETYLAAAPRVVPIGVAGGDDDPGRPQTPADEAALQLAASMGISAEQVAAARNPGRGSLLDRRAAFQAARRRGDAGPTA